MSVYILISCLWNLSSFVSHLYHFFKAWNQATTRSLSSREEWYKLIKQNKAWEGSTSWGVKQGLPPIKSHWKLHQSQLQYPKRDGEKLQCFKRAKIIAPKPLLSLDQSQWERETPDRALKQNCIRNYLWPHLLDVIVMYMIIHSISCKC